MARSCGDCTACCVELAIAPTFLQTQPRTPFPLKAPGTPCPHLQGCNGCGVYQDRPGVCRDFSCGWMEGLGGPGQRPDQLGLLFVRRGAGQAREAVLSWPPQTPMLQAFEVSGVERKAAAWELITRISAILPVVVMRDNAPIGFLANTPTAARIRRLSPDLPQLTQDPWR